MTAADRARYWTNLQAEIDGAALYRVMAEGSGTPEVAEVYRLLSRRALKLAGPRLSPEALADLTKLLNGR